MSPAVTALYDWDPQPLILPPSFPYGLVGGEGAVMTTSDPLGTVVLYGGEAAIGLTNLTITVDQSSGLWDVRPIAGAPSPRANASFVTAGAGREAVLFGGLTDLRTGATDNQTWAYNFVNRTWSNHTLAVAPPARESGAFAADDRAGYAVLFGGISPSSSLGGGGASVTWNDTWLLNLTTWNWTRANASGAPAPMFGASMIAVPPPDQFLLFGGCSAFCSNRMYGYTVGGNWSRVAVFGDVPTPRAGASMAWGPSWNLSVLSGGFYWGGNTYAALNDSFTYQPYLHRWDYIASFGGPSARYASAASYLSNNNCPGFFVIGGSSALALPPADGWFLDSNPDYGSGCNNWGGDQVGGPGGGGGGNCSIDTSLSVHVVDSTTGSGSTAKGIPGSVVQLFGRCGNPIRTANAAGFANFSALPLETVRVVSAATGFHTNETDLDLSLPNTTSLRQPLDPLPRLFIRTYGVTYLGGIAPLDNVSVVFGSLTPVGTSDSLGYLNLSGFAAPQGRGVFNGYRPGFSNASQSEVVPWEGNLSFSMTLLGDGSFDVHVVEFPAGPGIAGASGVITPVGLYTYGGPINFTADRSGWFNVSLPSANYTVWSKAPEFLPSQSSPRFHPWVDPTVVVVNLSGLFPSNVSVRLVDSVTHRPIGVGEVVLGLRYSANTSEDGWANFTNVTPPGPYGIRGSAPGYQSNSTTVDLTYVNRHPVVVLPLTPVVGCPPNCTGGNAGTSGPYRWLPSAGATLDLFLLVPVLLALTGATYAIYLRRKAEAPP